MSRDASKMCKTKYRLSVYKMCTLNVPKYFVLLKS